MRFLTAVIVLALLAVIAGFAWTISDADGWRADCVDRGGVATKIGCLKREVFIK